MFGVSDMLPDMKERVIDEKEPEKGKIRFGWRGCFFVWGLYFCFPKK